MAECFTQAMRIIVHLWCGYIARSGEGNKIPS